MSIKVMNDNMLKDSAIGKTDIMMPDQTLLQNPMTTFSRVLRWDDSDARLYVDMTFIADGPWCAVVLWCGVVWWCAACI